MDGSEEYMENPEDLGMETDEEDEEAEEACEIAVPDDWPSKWPKELINHPVELGDRIIAAANLPTPPKVSFMPNLWYVCLPV